MMFRLINKNFKQKSKEMAKLLAYELVTTNDERIIAVDEILSI